MVFQTSESNTYSIRQTQKITTQDEYNKRELELKGKIEDLLREYKMTIFTAIMFKSTDPDLVIEEKEIIVPSTEIIKPK